MEDFNFNKTLERIMEELDRKIESIMKPNPNEKARYTKFGFFNKYRDSFPMSKTTYYKYKESALGGMTLDTFYRICTYTDVSADYFLGFIDVQHKKQSAQKVWEEYGLTKDAMDKLVYMKTHSIMPFPAKYKNFSESEFVSFLIDNFAVKFEQAIVTYFYALDDLSKNQKKYMNNGKTVKDEYMHEEARIINDYQECEQAVYIQKYIITQLIDTFLDDLTLELTKKEADE